MHTLLAIGFVVIGIALFQEIPGHAWIGIGIVLSLIAVFVAAWFGITYLIRASMNIVLKGKN